VSSNPHPDLPLAHLGPKHVQSPSTQAQNYPHTDIFPITYTCECHARVQLLSPVLLWSILHISHVSQPPATPKNLLGILNPVVWLSLEGKDFSSLYHPGPLEPGHSPPPSDTAPRLIPEATWGADILLGSTMSPLSGLSWHPWTPSSGPHFQKLESTMESLQSRTSRDHEAKSAHSGVQPPAGPLNH
jgi:hypothetical protein